MKKLLLVGMVAIGFVHQASPMAFKRNKNRQFVPVIHAAEFRYREEIKENTVSEPVIPLIIVARGSDDKPITVPAKEYRTEKSIVKIKKNKQDDMPKEREIVTAVEMIDAKDAHGKNLLMKLTAMDKKAMQNWCDKFKKNSKKPGLWDKDYKEEKELNAKGCSSGCFLNDKLVKEAFKHIADEVNLDCSVKGVRVTYVDKTEYKEDPRYGGLTLTKPGDISLKGAQYFVDFDKSSHYKTLKQNRVTVENALENYVYHDALESLEAVKKEMQNDLSWFQWIFNNKKYHRTNKTLKRLNKEITWYKQPENRDLFAKSSMHPDFYRQLKADRE